MKTLNYGYKFKQSYLPLLLLDYKPLDAIAPDVFSSFGFTQLIDIPTRITQDTISLIDLFFVDNTKDIDCHGTIPKIADHEGIVVSFNLNLQKQKTKNRKVYDYKKPE